MYTVSDIEISKSLLPGDVHCEWYWDQQNLTRRCTLWVILRSAEVCYQAMYTVSDIEISRSLLPGDVHREWYWDQQKFVTRRCTPWVILRSAEVCYQAMYTVSDIEISRSFLPGDVHHEWYWDQQKFVTRRCTLWVMSERFGSSQQCVECRKLWIGTACAESMRLLIWQGYQLCRKWNWLDYILEYCCPCQHLNVNIQNGHTINLRVNFS